MVIDFKSLAEAGSYQKLVESAQKPYDLTGKQALQTKNRLERYVCRSELLDLHYGTERLDDKVLDLLQELADELGLVDQFQMMRRGEVLNRIEGFDSENRQVLHTASRDLFRPTAAEPKAAAEAREELERLRIFLDKVDSGEICNYNGERFDSLIHVGIGGSDLGPRAMFEALRAYCLHGRKVHFVANVDPDDSARALSEANLKNTLVCIVSKSGTTLETLTNEKLVRRALQQAGLNPAKHCIAVTGAKSPMDDPTRYLQSFYMHDYIGGRYSSTSMVGALTLGFSLGMEPLMEFLKGASDMDNHAEQRELRKNIPLLLALIGVWNHNFLGFQTLAVLPYSQALHRFPAHLQQCDMESNGKSVDRQGKPVACRTGPIVWGEPGTNGQHAFYQLLHQGTEIVPAEFIGFKRSQYDQDMVVQETTSQQKLLANLLAQMVAMAAGQSSGNPNRNFPGNRPSCLLSADKLTPGVMGALLATYEAKIVFQGFAWNINSFDQEGVQLGKVLANKFLRAMSKATKDGESLEETFLNQL
ncbi:MAG: glucose-6-phosphate isomerase [Desulforhopalus sp.]